MAEEPVDADAKPGVPPAGGNGAGKSRSETSYPYYGLGKVFEVVKAVQRAGGNEAAPATDVLREMKVAKTTDRQWAYGIPAAIMFGVIERLGRGDDAKIVLTSLGRRMALPGGPDEERATKVAAVRSVDLYVKLLEKFARNPVPSKESLKNILQRDFGILESMAGNAADAFLDSLKMAELVTPGGTISANDDAPAVQAEPDKPASNIAPPAEKANTKVVEVPSNFIIYRCKITKGRVIELPLPPEFTKADAERLYAFLQTQIDDDIAENVS